MAQTWRGFAVIKGWDRPRVLLAERRRRPGPATGLLTLVVADSRRTGPHRTAHRACRLHLRAWPGGQTGSVDIQVSVAVAGGEPRSRFRRCRRSGWRRSGGTNRTRSRPPRASLATCTCTSAPRAASGSATTCCSVIHPRAHRAACHFVRRSAAGPRPPLERRRLGLHRGQDRDHPRHPGTGRGAGWRPPTTGRHHEQRPGTH